MVLVIMNTGCVYGISLMFVFSVVNREVQYVVLVNIASMSVKRQVSDSVVSINTIYFVVYVILGRGYRVLNVDFYSHYC